MPSLAHAADLERVLTRAAEECESGGVWFGKGLPQALKSAIEASGKAIEQSAAEVAFIEAGAAPSEPPSPGARVVALSTEGLEELASVVRSVQGSKPRVARLICPVAVLDFTTEGIRVREIRHGLTAADLQRELSTRLWSGPDLKELGSH